MAHGESKSGRLKAEIGSLEAEIARDQADRHDTLTEIDDLIAEAGTVETALKGAKCARFVTPEAKLVDIIRTLQRTSEILREGLVRSYSHMPALIGSGSQFLVLRDAIELLASPLIFCGPNTCLVCEGSTCKRCHRRRTFSILLLLRICCPCRKKTSFSHGRKMCAWGWD